jgi:hypothetical protein
MAASLDLVGAAMTWHKQGWWTKSHIGNVWDDKKVFVYYWSVIHTGHEWDVRTRYKVRL